MKTLKLSLLLAGSMLVMLSSCKKDEEEIDKTGGSGCTDPKSLNYDANATTDDGSCQYFQASANDTSANSASTAMTMMNEDANIYNYATNTDSTSGKMAGQDSLYKPSCANVSVDNPGIGQPKTITIDFGIGCKGYDGKTRKGKIISEYPTLLGLSTGDTIVVTLENYSVNDTVITGTRYYWIKNSTLTDLSIGIKVENASIIYPNQTTATWEGTGVYSIALKVLEDYTDNELVIDFDGSGTAVDGSTYALTTPTPLKSVVGCIVYCPFVEGIAKVTTTKTEPYTIGILTYDVDMNIEVSLDFGTGTCDDGKFDVITKVDATTTIGNSTQTILNETYGPEQYQCGQYGK